MEPMHCLIEPGDSAGPVIVLLHGRGSDERDLLPLGRQLHATATIVSVRAPFAAAPWGYGAGWAWYRFVGGTTPEATSFVAGQEAIDQFIRSHLEARLGRKPGPLFIGGFSQGGTTSLAYALRSPGVVSGVMVFSGFLAAHPSVDAGSIGATAVWWGHGTMDAAIPFAHAEAGWNALREAGAELTTVTREGVGHTIDAVELERARTWLQERSAA